MKVLSINSLSNKNLIKQNKNSQVCAKSFLERHPSCDTVSFKSRTPKFKKTLYRAIGFEELENLLLGTSVGAHKYVTTNPMGYGAKDWASGFACRKKDVFFIRFKDDHFDLAEVSDRRDSCDDTRYIITKNVSIDDIHSIYEGHNINGEMIWAYEESLKQADRNKKFFRIQELLKKLEKQSSDSEKIVIELGSYAKQFPYLASLLMKNEKKLLSDFDLSYLIFQSNSANYYSYMKNLFEKSLEESDLSIVNNYVIEYMVNFAKAEDLDLVLKVFEKDSKRNVREYPKVISNVVTEKDVPRLERMFAESDYSVKSSLLWVFKLLDSKKITQKKAFEYCEKILNDIKDYKKEDYKKNDDLYDLLLTCVSVLDVENEYLGLKLDLIKCFSDKNLATDPDFKFYLEELTKK